MLFVIYQAFFIRNGISLSVVGSCSATILFLQRLRRNYFLTLLPQVF